MTQTRWDASDFDDEQTPPGRPLPTMVSLHFVRSALRRRWLVCALAAVLGLLAATAFLVASPGSHNAKSTLVLAHDPQADPSRAMATDVSLIRTRTVAAETIASLGLAMTPDEFLKSMTTEPVSSELLSVTLSAPTDAEAERRLTALTSTYLEFRAEQLSMQSNVLVGGMQERIKKLQGDVADLSRRIDGGNPSASSLSDAIAERANLQTQIETLQQSVEDATLRHTSVVSSSRVIDAAATDASGLKRRIVLTLASGLIGGLALGCGIVLFFAIVSDRLWRRSDVAAALEVPVPVSVGKITPVPHRWLWLPHLRRVDGRRTDERQRLARAIELELPVPGHRGRLAVACIENADEVRFALAAAAAELAARGRSIAVIDLTEHGSLDGEVMRLTAGSTNPPVVFRPRGIPTLAGGAADLRAAGHEDGGPPQLDRNDVTLLLADLDPSVGAHHLKAWTDRVIIPVTAGRSSAERVMTAAELIRTAGLEMRVAVLLRAERTDDSSGVSGFDQHAAVQLGAWHEQPLLDLEQPIDEDQRLTTETMTVTAATQVSDDQHGAASPVSTDERQPADQEQRPEAEQAAEAIVQPDAEVTAAERPADAEGSGAEKQQTVDQQASAVVANAEELVEAEMPDEAGQQPEAHAAEQPQAEEEQIEEQQIGERHAEAEVTDAEEEPDTEVSAEVELQPAEEERVEAVVATESGGPVETANADKDEPQPASEVAEVTETREQVVAAATGAELAESAGQPGAEVSEEQLAGEQMADSETADNEELVEAAMTAEGDQQPEAEQQANAEPKLDAEHAGDAEDSTGPNHMPDRPDEEMDAGDWDLYLAKYPPVHGASVPGSGVNGLDSMDLGSNHDSAVISANGDGENGKGPGAAPEVRAEADGPASADQPAADGRVSNGRNATKTRRRSQQRSRKA